MEKIQQPTPNPPTRDERVGLLAFQIWEQDGMPEGKSDEHWHRACEMIDAESTFSENKELPNWLNRQKETGEPARPAVEKSDKIETLNHKHQRRSAA